MRVDPETADKIRRILMLCRSRGVDPVEVLDRANLLDYEAKRRESAALLLEDVSILLEEGPLASALHAKTYRTPMDMKLEIIETLKGMVEQWRSGKPISRVPPGRATSPR